MDDLLTELQQAHRESPSWRLYGLCHQAATRIAELEAENDRLRNMLNGYGKLDAELAIAERRIEALSRTGAEKVRQQVPVTHPAPQPSGTVEAILHHLKIIEDEANRVSDPVTKNNLIYEIERIRFVLSALSPAPEAQQKPEGQQELVAVSVADIKTWRSEWIVENDPQDGTDCVTPFDKYLYTRPSEQAVTEAMVRKALHAYIATDADTPEEAMRTALKAAMEAGR